MHAGPLTPLILPACACFTVAQLYSPTILAMVRAFDRHDEPIAGQNRVAADLSIDFDGARYSAVKQLATFVLVVYGCLTPTTVMAYLYTVRSKLRKEKVWAAYGFLYDGT